MKTTILMLTPICLTISGWAQPKDPFATVKTANVVELESDNKAQFPIPKEDRKESGVRIVIEKIANGKATLLFLNDSNKTVYVAGHSLESPFYNVDIFSNGRWDSGGDHMNCGNGAYLSRVGAGKGFRFNVTIPKGATLFRVQAGFEGEADSQGDRTSTDVSSAPIHQEG